MSKKSDQAKGDALQRAAVSSAAQGHKRVNDGTTGKSKWLDCHVCLRLHAVDSSTARVSCPPFAHLGLR